MDFFIPSGLQVRRNDTLDDCRLKNIVKWWATEDLHVYKMYKVLLSGFPMKLDIIKSAVLSQLFYYCNSFKHFAWRRNYHRVNRKTPSPTDLFELYMGLQWRIFIGNLTTWVSRSFYLLYTSIIWWRANRMP